MTDREAEVAVVGAGLSGLVCARRLSQAGVSVCVLEASERVGGRTLGREIAGYPFDLGGQWIGPGQDRARALVEELGLHTFPTPHAGDHIVDTAAGIHRFRGTIPWLGVRPLAELGVAVARTYGGSLRVAPTRGAGTELADARSVESILAGLGPTARGVFDAAFRTVFGAEPGGVSLLWYLLYTRAGGGFFRLVDVEGGAQEQRIVEGAHTLAKDLAADLSHAVLLSTPVRRVAQTPDGVRLECGGPTIVRARRAVVAAPLTLLGRIEFEPALPRARHELASRASMGATVKVLALYERPFWRERGFSGQAVCGRGPLSVLFDNTTHDDRQAALVGFVVGDAARQWSGRAPDERRGAVLAQLAAWFGDEARGASELVAHDWSTEAWVGGCPVASPPPGVLAARAAALRDPVGRIHWAGTETAAKNPGYLDGAVSSGERAAAEVLRAL